MLYLYSTKKYSDLSYVIIINEKSGRNLILNDFVGYSKNLLISLIGHDILPGSGDVVVGRGCSEIVENKIYIYVYK